MSSFSFGFETTAWVTKEGELWMVGNGSGMASATLVPAKVKDGRVKIVTCGNDHSLYISTTGDLFGIGANAYGKLGKSFTGQTSTWVKMAENVRWAKADGYSSLWLDGDMVLWGCGKTIGTEPQRLAEGVTTAAATYKGDVLVLKRDGTLWAKGDNSHGQLGGRKLDSFQEIASDVVDISAGFTHIAWLCQSGCAYAMGCGGNGRLGTGATASRAQPVLLAEDVQQVACGEVHTLLLKRDGSLLSTGYGGHGEQGQGDTKDQLRPVEMSGKVRRILPMMNLTNCSAYVSQAGKVMVTGSNNAGQLGDDTTTTVTRPKVFQPMDSVSMLSLEDERKLLFGGMTLASTASTAPVTAATESPVSSPEREQSTRALHPASSPTREQGTRALRPASSQTREQGTRALRPSSSPTREQGSALQSRVEELEARLVQMTQEAEAAKSKMEKMEAQLKAANQARAIAEAARAIAEAAGQAAVAEAAKQAPASDAVSACQPLPRAKAEAAAAVVAEAAKQAQVHARALQQLNATLQVALRSDKKVEVHPPTAPTGDGSARRHRSLLR